MKQYEQVTKYKKVFKEADFDNGTPIDSMASKLNEIFSKTNLSSASLGRAIGMGLIDNIKKDDFKRFIKEVENGFFNL